jgi:small neutral amino acid transporter SnatA (MarC family)
LLFLIKSNQKKSSQKKASTLPAAKTSGAAEAPASIPVIAGPLFLTGLCSFSSGRKDFKKKSMGVISYEKRGCY